MRESYLCSFFLRLWSLKLECSCYKYYFFPFIFQTLYSKQPP